MLLDLRLQWVITHENIKTTSKAGCEDQATTKECTKYELFYRRFIWKSWFFNTGNTDMHYKNAGKQTYLNELLIAVYILNDVFKCKCTISKFMCHWLTRLWPKVHRTLFLLGKRTPLYFLVQCSQNVSKIKLRMLRIGFSTDLQPELW